MGFLKQATDAAAARTATELKKRFCERYGATPRVFRAPGRVNLIGEHTDYNDGFVMPSAIDFYIWVAISQREDRKLMLHSENFTDTVEIDLDQPNPRTRGQWSDYMQGIAVTLEQAGHCLHGANLLVHGDVPIGSGLSSSAAIEVATGTALLNTAGVTIPGTELAQLCRRAENDFVGAHVGIMDPFVSCCGHAGKALMLDCRSLNHRLLPIPDGISLVICNTMVKHTLATSEYNTRRQECEEGVRLLRRPLPHVRALRDVGLGELESHRFMLPPLIYRRCRHVISENARVLAAANALGEGDLPSFGKYMAESHASLRDDYQVSCPELDLMVKLAGQVRGVYGARMTGGGFGGCTINLVKDADVTEFQERVASSYQKSTGLTPQIFVSPAAEGASEVGT
jgi:galactokinase